MQRASLRAPAEQQGRSASGPACSCSTATPRALAAASLQRAIGGAGVARAPPSRGGAAGALRAAPSRGGSGRPALPRPPPPPPAPVAAAVSALTNLLTEALRLAGVGGRPGEPEEDTDGPPLRRGDTSGLLRRIAKDYARAYFVTGAIDGALYEDDALFADPTISFRGLALWRRNIRLLEPFLVKPRIELRGPPRRTGTDTAGKTTLEAQWRLVTGVRLPWRPLVDIMGSTLYVLSPESGRIERHVESWSVDGLQALLLLLRPGPPREEGGGDGRRAAPQRGRRSSAKS